MSFRKIALLVPVLVWAQVPLPSRPDAPKSLQPPKGQPLILHTHGKGDQIYVCKEANGQYAWTLKGPEAELFGESGERAGRHFGGPTWQANDGSRVVGRMTASVPSQDPESIPWLLLAAIGHDGSGVMSRVTSIQRLNTKGGKAPGTGCDAAHPAAEVRVNYEADYYFYGVDQPGLHGR
jgi:hypothetical protein